MTGDRYTLQRRALNNAWRWVDVMSSDDLDKVLAQARGGMKIYDSKRKLRSSVERITARHRRTWRESK